MPLVTATAACAGLRPVAKAIGLVRRNHVHPGHRQAGLLPQPVDHPVEFRCLGLADLLRPVYAQDDFVAEPVAANVHGYGRHQGDH